MAYVVILDVLERHWHTSSLASVLAGHEPTSWEEIHERFDEYLASEVLPPTDEEKKLQLLGLK